MSSYVIGKQEYIKAAGLISGLAEGLELWVYSFENGRNMIPDDYYEKFSEIYTMNALSVQEQYRDKSPETDSNDYRKDFEIYRKSGYSIAVTREGLKEAIAEIYSFFSSISYQIEKEAYMFKADMFLNRVLIKLMKELWKGYEPESWGTLENCLTKRTVTRIM